MCPIKTAFLHYSAPPVTGGVEAVIAAHARVFLAAGYPVTVIAGEAERSALPSGTDVVVIPEMGSQQPDILQISAALEQGQVPEQFAPMRDRLFQALRPVLSGFDVLIVHNVFTKHFNLPLTAALFQLLDEQLIGGNRKCIAWCHDLTWTSPHSRSKVFPGYPWDLLRTYRPEIHYVAVSEQRQHELSELLALPSALPSAQPSAKPSVEPLDNIEVIYNGVDPQAWYGMTPEGWELAQRLDLLSADLVLLMPVRVTQAKNIELAEQVAAALKARGCRPRLVITGPPDPHSEDSLQYYRSLLELRGKLGLEKEVCFVYGAANGAANGSCAGPETPYLISQEVVADLARASDVLFMPSHREGFGMPVLEAGLIGLPVIAADHVPAAVEIGGKKVSLFQAGATADQIAALILDEVANHRESRLRREVRQHFTWERIFKEKIEPILRK